MPERRRDDGSPERELERNPQEPPPEARDGESDRPEGTYPVDHPGTARRDPPPSREGPRGTESSGSGTTERIDGPPGGS
jgi:hypothetical protein